MLFNDLIQKFKLPSLQIPNVESISDKFAQMRSTIAEPFSRAATIISNGPAIFERVKFPKLPTLTIPKLPDPFASVKAGFLNLKDKIPKIGFPAIPPLPDVGGFFQGKVEDVTNTFQGVLDGVIGVAGDWKTKADRTKMIVIGVVVLVLGIMAVFAFKKK